MVFNYLKCFPDDVAMLDPNVGYDFHSVELGAVFGYP
jgi:hypothetical protein